jgi:hypothetical protein
MWFAKDWQRNGYNGMWRILVELQILKNYKKA